jgi:hypothetical protein
MHLLVFYNDMFHTVAKSTYKMDNVDIYVGQFILNTNNDILKLYLNLPFIT